MGGGTADAGAQKSREIERLIRQDEKRIAKEVKLLLLGTVVMTNLLDVWTLFLVYMICQ